MHGQFTRVIIQLADKPAEGIASSVDELKHCPSICVKMVICLTCARPYIIDYGNLFLVEVQDYIS